MSLKDAFPSGAIGDSATPQPKAVNVLPLTKAQQAAAEESASRIVGEEAAPLMVQDIFSGATEEAINSLLDWLASMADAANEIVIEDYEEGRPAESNSPSDSPHVIARYRLVPALQMTALQVRDVAHELKSLGINTGGGSFDVEQMVQRFAQSEDAAAKLFARLYIRSTERKYDRSTVQDRIPHMQELTIAQMMGALWRFFTANGFAPKGAIRGYLTRLAAQLVDRLKIPVSTIKRVQQG